MPYTVPFIIMALANLFTVSSFGCFFLFPLFITKHGGSQADIGIVMGAFALSSVLCRPWISDMIDRVGRKRSYTVGCSIMSALPLSYLLLKGDLSHFYPLLIFLRILHGIGLAICFTSVFTYIGDIVPKEHLNEGFGMFGVTGLTGMALGPIIGETIIEKFGFPLFFISATGMATLGLLLQLPLPESYVKDPKTSSTSFFSVFKKRGMFNTFLLAFLFGFGLAAFGNFVSPHALEQHVTFISLYYICYSSAAVFTRIFGGKLADRVGEERIIPYALILTGMGLMTLIFLGGNLVLALSGLISGCGHGLLFPSLNALAIRDEPITIRGKITGVFTGGIDTGALIGAVVLGYVGEWAGFRSLFFIAGLSLFLGLVVLKYRSI
ncbi:MAG: MFS transporter [Pseudomonadota bacterium]